MPGGTTPDRALALISLAVLLASATWFSGTAVAPELGAAWGLGAGGSAWLTSSVQLGFITGTFALALLNLADRFDARRVFAVSALAGAAANAAFAWLGEGLALATLFRFATGFALAGVYPVGMKLVASWSATGLGWRLGIMVGALVAGTAIPYGIRWLGLQLPWRATVLAASACATAGALVVLLLPLGPHLRTRAAFAPRMVWRVFTDPGFRANSFGYFGHMWELYALWSLIAFPLQASFGDTSAVPLLAFLVVTSGVVGCVGGGWLSRRIGERRTALLALAGSACACLASGLVFAAPRWVTIPCLLLWGVLVVADSPQFSALAARLCPPEYTATALTIQNGIGFAITILSIQCVAWTAELIGWRWAFLLLAPGPMLGVAAMIRLGRLVPSTLRAPP